MNARLLALVVALVCCGGVFIFFQTAPSGVQPNTTQDSNIIAQSQAYLEAIQNAAMKNADAVNQLSGSIRDLSNSVTVAHSAKHEAPGPAAQSSRSSEILSGTYSGKHFLSYKDLVKWHREGALVKRAAFSQEEVKEVQRGLEEIANSPDIPTSQGGKWKYYERTKDGRKILNRLERVADHPAIWKIAHDPRIIGSVSAMLGEEAVLFKDKSNFKLPGGGAFEAHQDIQPGWDSYATSFISVAVFVDRNLKENGCLEMAAGHHARGLLGRYMAALNETELAGVKFVHVETEPGDIVFFDGWAPHRSSDNNSDKSRRNIYLTYTRKSEGNHRERYYRDKHKTLPPDADQDPSKQYKYKV